MKRTVSAKFENGVPKQRDLETLSAPEGSSLAITVDDRIPWDDPRWMQRLLDDGEAERYLSSVDRDATV